MEKNLEALLGLDLPGSTVIVGDGPARAAPRAPLSACAFPRRAAMAKRWREIYASADVFVFPSRTDTFGIVLIEAMASGLPVAAFPVPGPIDVVGPAAGVLDEDLRAACLEALTIPREAARAYSLRFTWRESARQFLGHDRGEPPEANVSARQGEAWDWSATASIPSLVAGNARSMPRAAPARSVVS